MSFARSSGSCGDPSALILPPHRGYDPNQSVSSSRLAVSLFVLLLVCVAAVTAQRSSAPPPDGAALFDRSCRSCHNGDDPRAPAADAMAGRSPQAIVDALTSGSMRYQGLALSGAERRAVAEFLTVEACAERSSAPLPAAARGCRR
jgi:mono/diheme cytochrome c family protein